MKWAALVPELTVLDIEKSLGFYTDLLGFEVMFSRPEARFAYLGLGDAQLMLDQYSEGHGDGVGAPVQWAQPRSGSSILAVAARSRRSRNTAAGWAPERVKRASST